MPLNLQEEHILIDYFKTCIAVGDRVDYNTIFDLLMRIHNVETSRAIQLKEKCAFAELNELTDMQSCNLYTRTCDFLQMQQKSNPLSKEQQQIVAIKISAVKQLSAQGLCADAYTTEIQFWHNLEAAANNGSVDALRIGGLMMAEKLLSHNGDGLDWLNKAGSWLDYTSLMYLSNIDMPQKLVQYDINATLISACDYYGYPYPKQLSRERTHNIAAHNAFLLTSAVDMNKLSSDKIHPLYHKLIYSPILSESDKDRLLLRGEYSESELSLLPMDIHYGTSMGFDNYGHKFPRKADLDLLVDAYAKQGQTTLFVNCDDADSTDKLVDQIVNAHIGSNCTHVATIDAADLQSVDFDRSSQNVFVRNLVNGVPNALVLRIAGRVSTNILQQINEFFTDKQHYKLSRPNVVLNLSDVPVYCLCDAQNAQYFSDKTFVDIAPMTADEKIEYIRDIEVRVGERVTGKQQQYRLTDEMCQWLCQYPLKRVERTMCELFGDKRDQNFSFEQLKSVFIKYNKSIKQNGFGFGGHTV